MKDPAHDLDPSPRDPFPVRRRSPALNTVRPLLLAVAVLAVLGWYREDTTLLILAAGLVPVAGMLFAVIHTGYRRRVEQKQDVLCG
ncbi:MAG: hypothetical protein PVF05_10080 [Gemmatimonadales bacterium]|jgi:hypothetical protein